VEEWVPASFDEITVPAMTVCMMRDCRSGNDGIHDEDCRSGNNIIHDERLTCRTNNNQQRLKNIFLKPNRYC